MNNTFINNWAPSRLQGLADAVALFRRRINAALPDLEVGPRPGRSVGGQPGASDGRVPQPFTQRQAFWVLELAALNASDRAQALRTLHSWGGPSHLSGAQVVCIEELLCLPWTDLLATLADAMEDCALRERLREPGSDRRVSLDGANAAHSRAAKARELKQRRGEVFAVRGAGYRLGSHLPLVDSAYEETRVCQLLECDGHRVMLEDTTNKYRFSEALAHVSISQDGDEGLGILIVAPQHRA